MRSVIVREGMLDPERVVAIVEQVAAALDAAHGGRARAPRREAGERDAHQVPRRGARVPHGLRADQAGAGRERRSRGRGRSSAPRTTCRPSRSRASGPTRARTSTRWAACSSTPSPAGRPTTGTPRWRRCTRSCTTRRPACWRPVPGTPAGLDAVISRALAKEPEGRYPSAGDLGRAARAALDGSRPVAAGAQPGDRPGGAGGHRALAASGRAAAVSGDARDRGHAGGAPARSHAGSARGSAADTARARCPGALAACPAWPSSARWSSASSSRSSRSTGVFSGGGGGSDGNGSGSDQTGGGRRRRQPPPRWSRPSRPATAPTASPWTATRSGSPTPRGNSLTRLSAEANERIGAPIPVGRNPDEVEAIRGVVWVANTDDGTVTRVEGDGPEDRSRSASGPRASRSASSSSGWRTATATA